MLRHLLRCCVPVLGAAGLTAACNSERTNTLLNTPAASAPPAIGMPPLPTDREGAALTEYLIDGVAVFDKSSGAVENGTVLELPAVQSGYEWAVYAFDPQGNSLDSVALLLDVAEGGEVWIGAADYTAGRWRLSGPFDDGHTLSLTNAGTYLSPGGVLYIAVLAAGSGDTAVNALSVRTINPNNEPPVAALAVSEEQQAGTAPHIVEFDASQSSDDGSIAHYLWDFDGNTIFDAYTFAPQLTHVYQFGGTFSARVVVVDDEGAYGEAETLIAVNTPPIAQLVADKPVAEKGDTITFDITQSVDPDGGISDIAWDFDGDLIFGEIGAEANSAQLPAVQRYWDTPGPKVVSVRIADTDGAQATATTEILLHGWALVNIPLPELGRWVSLCDVWGHPAVSCGLTSGLYYAYSTTDHGGQSSEWQSWPVHDAGQVSGTSLKLVNGRPAIAYIAQDAGQIRYARSGTMSGAGSPDWSHDVVADLSANGFIVGRVGLLQAAGNPAIAAAVVQPNLSPLGSVRYDRAGEADGMNWTGFYIDTIVWELGVDLELVDGHPAMVYVDANSAQLDYRRSTTADGALPGDWAAVVNVTSSSASSVTLCLVQSRPAVMIAGGANMKYALSSTPQGGASADWDLTTVSSSVSYPSMAVINGLPAGCATNSDNNRFEYFQSGTPSGSDAEDWSFGAIDEAAHFSDSSQLCEISGRPCVVFADLSSAQTKFAIMF